MRTRLLHVNNATFTFPSSPLLTQAGDIPQEIICSSYGNDGFMLAARCRRNAVAESQICECVHIRRIPVGSTVEIILMDQGEIRI